MARQLGFYFTNLDESEFLSRSPLSDTGVLFLRNDLDSPKHEIYNQFDQLAYDETNDTQIFLCYKEDLSGVLLNRVKIKNTNKWLYYIDGTASPVIEYFRSGYNRGTNIIVAGRLWYEHKYWAKDEGSNSILVEKDKRLEMFYNSLVRWIKQYCTRLPNGNYIGPHAQKLYEAGAGLS